jgi:hypothetical protein
VSKKNEDKPEPTLVYRSFINGLSKVRRFGIEKHGNSEDWRTTEPVQHYDAAMRHLLAYVEGEQCDQESHLNHLYHAATNIMFEIERIDGKGIKCIVRHRKAQIQSASDSLTP